MIFRAGKLSAPASYSGACHTLLRRAMFLLFVAVGAAGVSVGLMEPVMAQQQPGAQQPGALAPAPEINQVRLNDKQVVGFLGAQKDLVAITAKLEAAGDTIDEKLQKELDEIGKKNGFKDFADFEEIRANIMMVLAGIDPDNGEYSDPIELIKKDIEAIKADKALSDADRKVQLEEMSDALKEMQPLKFKENIDVVKKHAKAIDEALK